MGLAKIFYLYMRDRKRRATHCVACPGGEGERRGTLSCPWGAVPLSCPREGGECRGEEWIEEYSLSCPGGAAPLSCLGEGRGGECIGREGYLRPIQGYPSSCLPWWNKLKTLRSRRTTYAGGNNARWLRFVVPVLVHVQKSVLLHACVYKVDADVVVARHFFTLHS